MGAIKELLSMVVSLCGRFSRYRLSVLRTIAERVALFFRYSVSTKNQFLAQIRLSYSGIDRAIRFVTLSQMQLFHALLRPALRANKGETEIAEPSKSNS